MSEISSRTSDRGNDIESATAEKAFEDGFDTDITRSLKDKEAGETLNGPNANTETDADAEPSSEQPIDQRPNYTTFTEWEKRGIVVGAAIGAFFSPLTAQIYLPALNVLAAEFDVTVSQINLTVTTYMVLPLPFPYLPSALHTEVYHPLI